MSETRISFLLNDLVREMNRQADALLGLKFGITYNQFVFLLKLKDAELIDITRLAESLGVTKGAVSKRLSWFVERDLAKTSQAENNAKRVLVSLKPKGAELVVAAGNYLERKFLASASHDPDLDMDLLRIEIQKMLGVLLAKSEPGEAM